MRSIQEVFYGYETFLSYLNDNHLESVYRTLLSSLDYDLRVYKNFNDPTRIRLDGTFDRDDLHGKIYALLSRRNEREWGLYEARRGCGLGCDINFRNVNSWVDVARVRDNMINSIVWRSGESTLDAMDALLAIHSMTHSEYRAAVEKSDFEEFMHAAVQIMI